MSREEEKRDLPVGEREIEVQKRKANTFFVRQFAM